MTEYPKKRDIDGVYFRVERDGKWDSICFTDMTEEEREKVCEGRSEEWLKGLAMIMAGALRGIADAFDLVCADGGE